MNPKHSDLYFRTEVRPLLTLKRLREALKATGWNPRGKGRRIRNFVQLLLDKPGKLPMRVTLAGSHYTANDGKAEVRVEAWLPGCRSHTDDVTPFTYDAGQDATAMIDALAGLVNDWNNTPGTR